MVRPLTFVPMVLAIVAAASLAACGAGSSQANAAPTTALQSASAPTIGPLGAIPDSARVSNGGPDPRSASYWIAWSTCGEGSQASVARANGGRDAGWILVDDLIADPGLALGDYEVSSCPEATRVLTGRGTVLAPGPADLLAREVLTAELNLSAGSETCAAVDGVVRVGQQLLSSLGYGASGAERSPSAREAALVAEVSDALAGYNAGTLCR